MLGANDISNTHVTLTLTAYAYCDTATSSVALIITTSPIADAGSNQAICNGSNIQLLATGGTTYLWSPGISLSDSIVANPIASPTTTTTYNVTVTSSCGSATANVTITVDNISPVNLGHDTATCLNSVMLDAGIGYDTYLWSTGASSQTISVDTTGVGYGTFSYWVEVSHGACTSKDTIHVTFTDCTGIIETLQAMPLSAFSQIQPTA